MGKSPLAYEVFLLDFDLPDPNPPTPSPGTPFFFPNPPLPHRPAGCRSAARATVVGASSKLRPPLPRPSTHTLRFKEAVLPRSGPHTSAQSFRSAPQVYALCARARRGARPTVNLDLGICLGKKSSLGSAEGPLPFSPCNSLRGSWQPHSPA